MGSGGVPRNRGTPRHGATAARRGRMVPTIVQAGGRYCQPDTTGAALAQRAESLGQRLLHPLTDEALFERRRNPLLGTYRRGPALPTAVPIITALKLHILVKGTRTLVLERLDPGTAGATQCSRTTRRGVRFLSSFVFQVPYIDFFAKVNNFAVSLPPSGGG